MKTVRMNKTHFGSHTEVADLDEMRYDIGKMFERGMSYARALTEFVSMYGQRHIDLFFNVWDEYELSEIRDERVTA